jgi:hypothetical protein
MNVKPILFAAAVLLAGTAHAALTAHNTDEVPPDSPWKAQGQPDAGTFNPAGGAGDAPAIAALPAPAAALPPAPAAVTYPPAIVIGEPARKPYALVAAPTLPCAPGYCPRRVRVDRH